MNGDEGTGERIFNPASYFLGPNRIESLEQSSDIIHHILHRDKTLGLSRLVFNNLKARRKIDRTLIVDISSLVVAVDAAVTVLPALPLSPAQERIPTNGSLQTQNEVKTPSLAQSGIRILTRGEPDTRTRASYGIYFGAGSVHNMSGVVTAVGSIAGSVPTKETAILKGCTVLLNHILSDNVSTLSTPSAAQPLANVVILTSSPYLTRCLSSYIQVWEKNGYVDSRGMFVENATELRDLESVVQRCEDVGLRVCFWLVEGSGGKEEMGGLSEARKLAEGVEIADEGEKIVEETKKNEMAEGIDEKNKGRNFGRNGEVKNEGELRRVGGIGSWNGNRTQPLIETPEKFDGRQQVRKDVNILLTEEDMYDMEALELELENGFASF
ncbi:hypothetical protein VTL71DRAFT_2684 [Oculimacula yallundae]|uniref:Uncharacterized protein n=1 Tax=Oculimacula yallundae TaxID=86028 RepID=A0ABR4C9K8_9HELO